MYLGHMHALHEDLASVDVDVDNAEYAPIIICSLT